MIYRTMLENNLDNSMMFDDLDLVKIIEVAQPERMLDAKTKTAMLTVATWADYYRIGEEWSNLQHWRLWKHGKRVNEVSHFGEYTTMQGDILTVCPIESEDVICQVQVTDIRMVDCRSLSEREVLELGYEIRDEYDAQWRELNADSPRGWYMRIMLMPGEDEVVQ